MATAANAFQPDYAVPPGSVLEERLEAEGTSHAEFARRCGRSAKLISEIIAGRAPIEPDTALQFERVLGVDASIWLGIESAYRLHQTREAEAANAERDAAWVRSFPIKELVARDILDEPSSQADAVGQLLSFFRVGTIDAWRVKYGMGNIAYRNSPSFESSEAALATWLRLGEMDAERQKCTDFDRSRFTKALKEIRGLTRAPLEEALVRARELCNQSGVALALVRPLLKTALSGATWWLTPRKAVIQLSARHKTDDHLWFSLFHEAAHILLHSKKTVFVEGPANDEVVGLEAEADAWASNMLVRRDEWARFVASGPRSARDIDAFAERQGIAPGIVVGMLQHTGHLPWTHLNGLKVKLAWRGPA